MDTTSSNPASDRAGEVLLGLGMLESYEHMGYYSVECVSGCTCAGIPQQSATHSKHTSDYRFVYFTASQHPACRFRVTSLLLTDSGEHKVKFDTLMIGTDIDTSLHVYSGMMHKPQWTGTNADQTADHA